MTYMYENVLLLADFLNAKWWLFSPYLRSDFLIINSVQDERIEDERAKGKLTAVLSMS